MRAALGIALAVLAAKPALAQTCIDTRRLHSVSGPAHGKLPGKQLPPTRADPRDMYRRTGTGTPLQIPGGGTGGTPFSCDSTSRTCVCKGVADCMSMHSANVCGDTLKCDDHGCTCGWRLGGDSKEAP